MTKASFPFGFLIIGAIVGADVASTVIGYYARPIAADSYWVEPELAAALQSIGCIGGSIIGIIAGAICEGILTKLAKRRDSPRDDVSRPEDRRWHVARLTLALLFTSMGALNIIIAVREPSYSYRVVPALSGPILVATGAAIVTGRSRLWIAGALCVDAIIVLAIR